MTDDSTKKLFELYDLMEEKLAELNITFDEFHVLYRAFRNPPVEQEDTNPFPWVQSAGKSGQGYK